MEQVLIIVGTFLVMSFGPVVAVKVIHLPGLTNKNIHFMDLPILAVAVGTCLIVGANL